MRDKDSKDTADWLTLGEASRLLGIHEATLRHWADQGAVPFFRTPGGHRRFVLRDLQAFLAGPRPTPAAENYLQVVLQHAQEALHSPQVVSERWYRSFSPQEKEERRASGRKLLGLLMQYLSSRDAEREKAVEEVRKMAWKYGEDAARRRLSAQEVAKAFLFFRDFLIDSSFQTAEEGFSPRIRETYLQLNQFLNEFLLAMIAAYEEMAGKSALKSPRPL